MTESVRLTVSDFASELAALRRASGSPSFQRMESLSAKGKRIRLPKSTAFDAERGTRLAPLWVVLGFIGSCHDSARELGIEISEERFSPPVWRDRWYRAKTTRDDQSAQLEKSCRRTDRYPCGVTVEWTDEGPKVYGDKVSLSQTEVNALLDKWMERIDGFVEQGEVELGTEHPAVFPRGRVLSVISACGDTYNAVPDENELRQLTTELARKFNLFYKFVEIMHVTAGVESGDCNVPELFELFDEETTPH